MPLRSRTRRVGSRRRLPAVDDRGSIPPSARIIDETVPLSRLARMVRHRLWGTLEDAEGGAPAAVTALFTVGGCHAFAFAQAIRLKGKAILMTEIMIPGFAEPEPSIHAWCATDSGLIDYFGKADDAEELLGRFHKKNGGTSTFVKGTKPSKFGCLSVDEIVLILARPETLPNGFFKDPLWLPRAMKLAEQLIKSEGR